MEESSRLIVIDRTSGPAPIFFKQASFFVHLSERSFGQDR